MNKAVPEVVDMVEEVDKVDVDKEVEKGVDKEEEGVKTFEYCDSQTTMLVMKSTTLKLNAIMDIILKENVKKLWKNNVIMVSKMHYQIGNLLIWYT